MACFGFNSHLTTVKQEKARREGEKLHILYILYAMMCKGLARVGPVWVGVPLAYYMRARWGVVLLLSSVGKNFSGKFRKGIDKGAKEW